MLLRVGRTFFDPVAVEKKHGTNEDFLEKKLLCDQLVIQLHSDSQKDLGELPEVIGLFVAQVDKSEEQSCAIKAKAFSIITVLHYAHAQENHQWEEHNPKEEGRVHKPPFDVLVILLCAADFWIVKDHRSGDETFALHEVENDVHRDGLLRDEQNHVLAEQCVVPVVGLGPAENSPVKEYEDAVEIRQKKLHDGLNKVRTHEVSP